MAKQNLNPFSLFLVNWQQEGAEKALNNQNDCSSVSWLHFSFSFSAAFRASANPSKSNIPNI
jgi:hypothetical protein